MDVNIKELIMESWKLYRTNIRYLIASTYPWILASSVLAIFDEDSSGIKVQGVFWAIFIALLSIAVDAALAFSGFRAILKLSGEDAPLTKSKFINYILASGYVGVCIMLASLFFIIPGIIVGALVSMFPILILKENQGPIECVSNSILLTRDYWLKVTIFLAVVVIFVAAIQVPIGFIFSHIGMPKVVCAVLLQVVSGTISLYWFVVISVLYSCLRKGHNGSVALTAEVSAD